MTPFLLSAFVAPGAGQLYRREFLKGGVILGLCLFGLSLLFADLWIVVNASLQAEPLLDMRDIVGRAIAIRQGINLRRFLIPVAVVLVSYVWGVIDVLCSMRKDILAARIEMSEKESGGGNTR